MASRAAATHHPQAPAASTALPSPLGWHTYQLTSAADPRHFAVEDPATGRPGAVITLSVHSSLDAVGLTAAVARQLATGGISCSVVAGYFHDRLFVPIDKADLAVNLLRDLTKPQT